MKKLTVEKPWGRFEQFTHNEQSTVKVLTVQPNQSLSLQYHHKRDELWRLIDGSARITIDGKIHKAKKGDEFFIPKGARHRIETQEESAQVLEVSFGFFDENDIVRLEDRYDRTSA